MRSSEDLRVRSKLDWASSENEFHALTLKGSLDAFSTVDEL